MIRLAQAGGVDALSWTGGTDVITHVVETALSQGRGSVESLPVRHKLAIRQARELLELARRDGAFRASLPQVLDLIDQLPLVDSLQITAARMITEGRDSRHALAAWRGIHSRFPLASEAFRLYIRLVRRTAGPAAAEALLQEHFPGPGLPNDAAELVVLGFGLEELGRHDEAEQAFGAATRLAPLNPVAWRRLAALQRERGALTEAEATLSEAARHSGGPALIANLHDLRRKIYTLQSLAPDGHLDGKPMSIAALDAILRDVMWRRIDTERTPARDVGSTLIIGGSLGSGGAERQLVTTVLGLVGAVNSGEPIDGVHVNGPVAVCCRSLNPKQGNDFFAGTLRDAGVPVSSYLGFEPYGGRIKSSAAREYCTAIEFLPPRMREGVIHLVDYLRDVSPEIVHVWQDGMIFATGLAALIAGVPRIVLSARTLPPTERADRMKLELEPIYKALMSAPGVVLTANSRVAARAYEAWLGVPEGVVPVIVNGVAPLNPAASPADRRLYEGFMGPAAGEAFVVGGVMRFDQNKRPLDWLDVAAKVAARRPNVRFVLVGDGVLLDEAKEYAARLGLRERVLFVGRSQGVGYWLSNFDALLLTSRFEGTPNVLIEAQLAGVPVVTTPAGGAAETLQEGVTGFVLSNSEIVDVAEAADRLDRLIAQTPEERTLTRDSARRWVEERFSVDSMLAQTVSVYTMDLH